MKRALLLLLVAATASANPRRVVSNRRGFSPEGVYKVPRGSGPSEGPADAPITVVMWSDFACSFCNRAQTQLDQLKRLYPGQIRLVHRTLPLDDDNLITAEAALAAGAQGRFRPMSDRLYGVSGHVDRPGVELFARELGLDMVRFRADLDTGVHRAQLRADMDDARTLGISGTPMFFINGRPISGSQSLKIYVEVVDAELARARAAHPTGDLYDALVADGRSTADVEEVDKTRLSLDTSAAYKVGLGLPGHQVGPDDALVTIVEWSDFQCPFCAKQVPALAHARDKYKGSVRIIYRHLAMSFHRQASLAAEAAVAAADQGKFWEFHDQIWANFGHLARADLEQYAEAIHLDMPAFRAALDERRYHDLVASEGADAIALGVDGTPTLFVNGKPLVGAHDATQLDAAIDAALDAARTSAKAGLAPIDYYAVVMSGAAGEERADPSTIPIVSTVHFEMSSEERGRAAAAACRRRDGARATKLGANLAADVARRIRWVCAGEGIDLR